MGITDISNELLEYEGKMKGKEKVHLSGEKK